MSHLAEYFIRGDEPKVVGLGEYEADGDIEAAGKHEFSGESEGVLPAVKAEDVNRFGPGVGSES